MCSEFAESGSVQTDFDPKWKGLNINLLRDIFNSHKVFTFGASNCAEYGLREFRDGVQRAEREIFGKEIVTPHVTIHVDELLQLEFSVDELDPNPKFYGQCKATLYPQWLVADNLFAVFRRHFAVSQWLNNLKREDIGKELNVFCCVIPENVVSLYDHELVYEHSISDFEGYLDSISVDVIQHRVYNKAQKQVFELVKRIEECTESLTLRDSKDVIVLLFDRRNPKQNGNESLTVFRSPSIDEVAELSSNHFVGFHFNVRFDGSKSSKCWLHYGNGQRLRFWTEQLVWFIPRLFVKGKQSGYQFAKRLYSDDFKHGFCLNLNDPIFNRFYKILTSWTHQTVNYRRTDWAKTRRLYDGFRDFVDWKLSEQKANKLQSFWDRNGFSTDDIFEDLYDGNYGDSNIAAAFDGDIDLGHVTIDDIMILAEEYGDGPVAECTMDHPVELWRCHHIQVLVENLKNFQSENFEVDVGNVVDFDESAVIRGIDHLAQVHALFADENKRRIRNYIKQQIHCDLGIDCEALKQHCSRRRELDLTKTGHQKHADLDEVESILVVTEGALSSAHCYLLHSDETLYRLSGQSHKFEMNPFSTSLVESKDEEKKEDDAPKPLSIDFGVHVLQWLPFGMMPLFNSFYEEMVKNPASTLTPQILDEFKRECIAKLDGLQWTEDNIDELLCLKLYSDCTEFQNLFRRAYWKSSSLETKRSFYQWAIKMYQTFLFHAQPIPTAVGGGGGPRTLYHGLNKLFQVDDTAPTYQGPFSTTDSNEVARTFANGQGLIFSVQSSYANPLRFLLGIDMIRISCFKHEREILLYSATLPIKSTETFEESDEKVVDHFLFSLRATKKAIADKAVFLKKLGVKMRAGWTPLIVKHPILMKSTEYIDNYHKGDKPQIVLQRLVEEMNFGKWFYFCFCREHIAIKGHSIRISTRFWTLPQYVLGSISHCVFTVSVNEASVNWEWRFDAFWNFRIPLVSPALNLDSSRTVTKLLFGPRDGSFDAVVLKEWESHHLSPRYAVNREEPLQIDRVLKVAPFDAEFGENGTVDIRCTSDILVAPTGGITANGTGLKAVDECTVYDQYTKQRIRRQKERESKDATNSVLRFGTLADRKASESKESKIVNAGQSGGGGIIALHSSSDIVNDGVLSSKGSAGGGYGGGSIFLCTDGAVINRGEIDCSLNGDIIVRCRQFVNEGVISSEPGVLITDGTEQREIEMVMMPWTRSGGKLQEIPLTVHSNRGHYEKTTGIIFKSLDKERYHPRNLLDKKGIETWYIGKSPAVGDWITFKIESPFIVIPKAVIIRNSDSYDIYGGDYGLKSISLSLSVDGDEFEDFAVIKDIEGWRAKGEEQYLNLKDVMVSNTKIWMNDYKFIKLKVLSNWGGGYNEFCSFFVLGVVCESKE